MAVPARTSVAAAVVAGRVRGSGSRGLAGMRYRAGDLARPLLGIDRKQVEQFIASLGLIPRRDASNDDPRFTRNRLRQQLLPTIDAFDPSARELLARTADILAEEDRYLDEQVARLPPRIATDPQAFRTLPPALQRRVIRQLIPQAGFAETEAARRDDAPLATSIDRTSRQSATSTHHLIATACRCDPASFKARDQVGHLDGDLVQLPLTVGTRKPGDRMRPLGVPAPKRVQDILVDAHVPRHLRDGLPIVSDREEIVWIPGVTVSERKRIRPQTTHQLHLEIVRG